MCGVIAYYSPHPHYDHEQLLMKLLLQARIRGLHAVGVALADYEGYNVDRFFELSEAVECITNYSCDYGMRFGEALLHTRYCTSGDWEVLENNQPVVYGNYALVFNGVISMKTKEEMEREYDVSLLSDNDGELFLQHISKGGCPVEFVRDMKGSFAGAWFGEDGNTYFLRNERRPLWYVIHNEAVFVASTLDIFVRAWGEHFASFAVEAEPLKLYIMQEMA